MSERYTCGPTKSTYSAVSRSEKPLSRPVTSMPQAPSPSDTGCVAPVARTALHMAWAHAVTTSVEGGSTW